MTANRVKFKAEAEKAIAAANNNPFTRKLGLVPVIQVMSPNPVDNFPCRFHFVGVLGNCYVYNLDAQGVLNSLNYEDLEFNI